MPTFNDPRIYHECEDAGGGTLVDSSGHGLDSTLGGDGTTTFHVPGKIDFGVSVDGAVVVTLAENPFWDTDLNTARTDWTIAMWVKPTVDAASAMPLLYASGDSVAHAFTLNDDGGRILTFADNAGNTATSGPFNWNDGLKHHVAAVSDAGFVQLWIDGVKSGDPVHVNLADSGGGTNRLLYGSSAGYSGMADEFRTYTRALSDADMVALAAYAIPDTPTGLAAGAITTTTIALSWNAASGATGYRIYSATDGYVTPIYDGATASTTVTGLTANTAYHFKVSAYNAAGESAKSSAILATTQSAVTDGEASDDAGSLVLGVL